MSTRSRIAMKLKDNTFKSIYCHWDGYPSHQMPLLTENYNKKTKIEKLLRLGDISQLNESPEKPEGHSFETPVPGHVIAYRRDRGEKNVNSVKSPTFKDLVQRTVDCWGEYLYVFADNSWACYDSDGEMITEY